MNPRIIRGMPIINPIIVMEKAIPIISIISPRITAISLPVTLKIPSTSLPIAIKGAINSFTYKPPHNALYPLSFQP